MFTARDIWAGVVLPGGVSALVLLVAWRLTRRRISACECRTWAAPLAVALGFAGGYAALLPWPAMPPHDVVEWLPWLAPPLAVLGTLEAWRGPSLSIRTTAAAIFSPLTVGLIAWPLLARGESSVGPWLLAGVTLLAFIWLMTVEELAGRVSAARFSAIQLAALLPASATLALSGSMWLAQIALVLAATQAGAFAAQVVLGRAGQARGAALVVGVLFGGLLWYGWLYSNLSTLCAALLFLAPQITWLTIELPRQFSSLRRAGVQVGCVALLAVAALVLAWAGAPAGEL